MVPKPKLLSDNTQTSPAWCLNLTHTERRDSATPAALTVCALSVDSQAMEKELYCHRLELQVQDLQQHIKQMIQLTNLQDQENKRMQR